ncbi:Receptor-like protein kinase [Corchorus capsularis]|uniref:Receptor-like protein kinase n=1 Tax=Corchorus capsularis TaxID=210143 RepID=A0A1R3HWE0_COCAP|nr:Receptor-like protein kinase [Corchorus capsularis]
MINVALLCTNPSAAARPSMSSVVSVLEGKADVHEFVRSSSICEGELNAERMRKYYEQIDEENDADKSQTKSILADGPWTSSSTSAADLRYFRREWWWLDWDSDGGGAKG